MQIVKRNSTVRTEIQTFSGIVIEHSTIRPDSPVYHPKAPHQSLRPITFAYIDLYTALGGDSSKRIVQTILKPEHEHKHLPLAARLEALKHEKMVEVKVPTLYLDYDVTIQQQIDILNTIGNHVTVSGYFTLADNSYFNCNQVFVHRYIERFMLLNLAVL